MKDYQKGEESEERRTGGLSKKQEERDYTDGSWLLKEEEAFAGRVDKQNVLGRDKAKKQVKEIYGIEN